MPRTKGGIVTRRQHKKIIKMAKGHRGGATRRSGWPMSRSCTHSGTPTSTGAIRKETSGGCGYSASTRPRAARAFSRASCGLSVAGVDVDRKILADLAVRDDEAFGKIAETAKAAVAS